MVIKDVAYRTAGMARVQRLLDRGSFVEIGGRVCARLTDFYEPHTVAESDGVITGYGTIGGHVVYVFSQDEEVMGGSFGEMHGQKIVHLYQLAMRAGAPVIGLLSSSGLRVEEGMDALNKFGELYAAVSGAGSKLLQIMAVVGQCGGGMSVVCGQADFLFVEKERGKLFVQGSVLVDGEVEGSPDQRGLADAVLSEEEIDQQIRTLVETLPANTRQRAEQGKCCDSLNRECAQIITMRGEGQKLLTALSDAGFFFETRRGCGEDMVCGLLRLDGMVCGGIACSRNADGQMRMTAAGLEKAADFVRMCDKFHLPLITLTDVEGFAAGEEEERRLPQAAGRFLQAISRAQVPKINLIIGQVKGSAYSLLNSRGLGADYVFMWDGAKVSMLDSRQAAQMLEPKADLQTLEKKAAEYEESHCSAMALARHGYVDKVIAPAESRKYLIGALQSFVDAGQA